MRFTIEHSLGEAGTGGHVVYVIEAPYTGATVQYSPLPAPAQIDAYVHVS